jgi:hypothetical protein
MTAYMQLKMKENTKVLTKRKTDNFEILQYRIQEVDTSNPTGFKRDKDRFITN